MSDVVSQLTRQTIIIRVLKEHPGPIPAEEIYEFIRQGCEIRGISYPVDKKARSMQFSRDRMVIAEVFGIEIEYVRPLGYMISREVENPIVRYEQLFEDFDFLTSLRPEDRTHPFIYPEYHRGAGSLCLGEMLYAIKNCHPVKFDYHLVRQNLKAHYVVNPCFLKENQERWYIGAMDRGELKFFALDRISNPEILHERMFARPNIDVDALWRDCYGIWDDLEQPVEDIVLRYSRLDGEFVKRVPLHHSQKILSDTPEELTISVRLRISNDFIMALLARSGSVEILEPLHLRNTIKEICSGCADRNR